MMNYNYRDAMAADIREYLRDNFTTAELVEKLADRDKFEEQLRDDLWVCDSITGNASGSYWFSTYKAEEAICHNLSLLGEALEEFGCRADLIKKGAEWADVTIRCYLLNEMIYTVLEEIETEIETIEEVG